jgi:hypothetical protein
VIMYAGEAYISHTGYTGNSYIGIFFDVDLMFVDKCDIIRKIEEICRDAYPSLHTVM